MKHAICIVLALSIASLAQTPQQDSGKNATEQSGAVPVERASVRTVASDVGPEPTVLNMSVEPSPEATRPAPVVEDFNQAIYYRNKLELSVESGWLSKNIPFPFDFLVGDSYVTGFRHYTLVPTFVSLRWQTGDLRGPGFLRGNMDLTFTGSYTAIPRGHAETRYFAFDFGMRRNFVPRNWRVAPYFEARGGIGNINAKGPASCCPPRRGLWAAQGQDLTFTLMLGSGIRYNLSPRCSVSAGVAYMHVSNAYLSEPRFEDYGINVVGPMVGVNLRLGKAREPKEVAAR